MATGIATRGWVAVVSSRHRSRALFDLLCYSLLVILQGRDLHQSVVALAQ
jgi:hypothetical protein